MSGGELRPHLPALALLAVIPFGLLALPILGLGSLVPFDRTPHDAVLWDAVQQDTPWKIEAQRAFASGRVPLYQHGAFCGSPLLANDQVAALYPGNALYLVTDAVRALGPTVALHLVLAALGMYALVLRLGGSREGGVVAGVSFTLSATLLAFLPHPQMTAVMALAPWVLWAVRGAATACGGSAPRRVALLALAVALSVLGGHLQYTALTLLAAATLLLLPGGRIAPLLGIALGLGIGSAQMLPTLEYATSAARKPLEVQTDGTYQHALPPGHLPVLVWPEAFGSPELGHYRGGVNYRMYGFSIGFVPLALLLGRPREKAAQLLAALALLALLLALGGTAYGLLHRLPGWESLKPARCLALFTLAASALAGLSLPSLTWRRGAAALALVVLAAATVIPRTPPEVRPVQLASLARIGLAALALLGLGRTRAAWRDRAVALLAVAELFIFALPFARSHPVVDPYPETAVMRALRERGERFSAPRWDLLLPNVAMAVGLEDARGTDSFIPRRYHELVKRIDPASDDMVRVRLRSGVERPAHALLASTIVAAPAAVARAPGLLPLELGGAPAYRDPRSPGLAYVPARPRAVAGEEAARDTVLASSFEPARDAVVEGAPPPVAPDARVAGIHKSSNRIALDVEVRAPSLLVVLSGWQPGFRARGTLGSYPVVPADAAFLGVTLPAGERRVELRYEPASYRIGLFGSAVALAATLALLLGGATGARRAI